MRQIALILAAILLAAPLRAEKYAYDTVPGDPMKTKIYTLANGLKVYMSVNPETPRIQTNIAVRVGGKNDPAETTGLAHYFEHLMFKGTPYFGTTDYAAEKPMLDEIEALFETYRATSDSTARAAIYHRIDSISYEASKIAIPNEYDKLMSAIGSTGTNAYTSEDMTCYVENIPSNQLENWALIQAQRFAEPVLRGFHTELETIYEEKNMSLTDDGGKVIEGLFSLLFPHHPYGTQTVLGTQEHLKNPSITNVRNYHSRWYVPNNMAIILAGDFDPDTAVDIIERHFGSMTPSPSLEMLSFTPEAPIAAPLEAEVTGQEAEFIIMGWRFPGASAASSDTLSIIRPVLSNGKAGLIDTDINQAQRMLGAGAAFYSLADYSLLLLQGAPKAGQTLDEVRDLLLSQAERLANGDFDEALLEAIINNYKLGEQRGLESNDSRVDAMVDAFINGTPWEQTVGEMDRMASLTKDDITAFAKRHLRPDNYAIVYKRQGQDTTIVKMPKPRLTPIETNRDKASDFLTSVQNSEVTPIEPRFVDFDRDLTIAAVKKDIPLYYKHNDTNDIFSLTYVFETGSWGDRLLDMVGEYNSLLSTPTMTAEEIHNRFYALACSYYVTIGKERSYITLTGLSENMPEAMRLMETVMAEAVPDAEVYEAFADRVLKSRDDAKGDQGSSLNALISYATYGPEYVAYGLTNDEIKTLDPATPVEALKRLRTYPHRIIYYGPMSQPEVTAVIDECHYTPEQWAEMPEIRRFEELLTPVDRIYIAPYDSNQLYMEMTSNDGERYNPDLEPLRRLYNAYFGGDMSSIVFQEMRESRSLAYSASAGYAGTSRLADPYTYYAFIATQNDKMMDAIDAFKQIINDMPQSENAWRLAKDGVDTSLRTQRVNKQQVAWALIGAQDLGLDEPVSRKVFQSLPAMTLDDVVGFQQGHVKDRTFTYCILGRIDDLDLDALRAIGEVVILTPEQTFGY